MKELLEKEQTEMHPLLNLKFASQNRLIGEIRELNGRHARIEKQREARKKAVETAKERKRKLELKEEGNDETAKKQKL